jgi:acid phosphatase family membrane protein YuiD
MTLSVSHKIILLWALSGLLAQSIKVMLGYFKERRVDLRRLVEPGGMPSSHSSAASTLTVVIGLASGFDSPLFAIVLFFSLVVMYEATGLRRAAGRQAKMLNKLADMIYEKRVSRDMKLRELLGHTPVEVFLGCLMGVIFALAFF